MRSDADIREVFRLAAEGQTKLGIARATGVSRAQVRAWLRADETAVLNSPMRRARAGSHEPGCCPFVADVPRRPYAYLLGQYLGDGMLTRMPRDVYKLRVFMCDAYPEMRRECVEAIEAVMPDNKVGYVQKEGCTEV